MSILDTFRRESVKSKPQEALKKWSEYSQRTVIKQRELEGKIEHCGQIVSFVRAEVTKLQEMKKHQVEMVVGNRNSGDYFLPGAIVQAHEKEEALRLYEERKIEMAAQLEALQHPLECQIGERSNAQTQCAVVVAARLEKDREIDASISRLAQMLQERAALSAEMRQLASKIDLTLSEDGLDEARFAVLAASLPTEMASKSQDWAAHFLGEQQGTKPFVVRAKQLIFPETLKDAQVFRSGERVELTERQASELARAGQVTAE